MKKFYYPTDQTLKRNILKFLEDDSQEQMLVVDLAFNNNEEDYEDCDEFYITKPTAKNRGDFLEQFLTDMMEEGIEEVPENVLLGFHDFNDMAYLTLEDLENVKGKTLNHKIANYVISYVRNSANYYISYS
uniref:hypothetical protein n=1 Tax=Actinobacillus pleuropneumoniae TaxID=715 RepID=UPI00155DA92A|nr:hypothetical protein [Actinobacillus pleuropneumoniae]